MNKRTGLLLMVCGILWYYSDQAAAIHWVTVVFLVAALGSFLLDVILALRSSATQARRRALPVLLSWGLIVTAEMVLWALVRQ